MIKRSCILHRLYRVYAVQWGLNKGNPLSLSLSSSEEASKVSVRDKPEVNERPTPTQESLNYETLQVQHKQANA